MALPLVAVALDTHSLISVQSGRIKDGNDARALDLHSANCQCYSYTVANILKSGRGAKVSQKSRRMYVYAENLISMILKEEKLLDGYSHENTKEKWEETGGLEASPEKKILRSHPLKR